jgi:hypothetical protein
MRRRHAHTCLHVSRETYQLVLMPSFKLDIHAFARYLKHEEEYCMALLSLRDLTDPMTPRPIYAAVFWDSCSQMQQAIQAQTVSALTM